MKDVKNNFLAESTTPLAKKIGNTLSSIWTIVFGDIDLYAQKKDFERAHNLQQFKEELEQKVSSVPEKKLVEPPFHVLGPTLEASKYYFENGYLRSMFANLIASSINIDFTNQAHPSFVEIIKQLSPDEAKIVQILNNDKSFPLIKLRISDKNSKYYDEPLVNFSLLPFLANCDNPDLGPSYIDNLRRLGLISTSYSSYKIGENVYEPLLNHHKIKTWFDIAHDLNKECRVFKGVIIPTDYGKKFIEICVS